MNEPRVVVVSATGSAAAPADAVVLQLAVEVVADDPAQAVSRVAALVEQVLAVLDAAGVDAADRQTTGLSVHPHWDEHRPGLHSAQYALRVVTSDVTRAGALVQRTAEAAGSALQVRSFELAVRDAEPALVLARQAAVRACRERAGQLAEAAGERLGPLLRLVEGTPVDGGPPRAVAMELTGPAVEPGTGAVSVTVTATYALQP